MGVGEGWGGLGGGWGGMGRGGGVTSLVSHTFVFC